MPRLIEGRSGAASELGDLIEALETGGFDPEDEDSLAAFAPDLRRLAANRRFLGDLMIEELKQSCAGQVAGNHYGAQVILLHGASRKFMLRANFWPSVGDSAVVSSGERAFFYGVPHDHNFSFLTVGYVGPGYWSDYYEYDYSRTAGVVGEAVDLRFVERSRLSEGKVLLYRRHLDVHNQHAPDSLSVSLNVIALSDASDFYDQYSFDLERRRISGIINRNGLETLVALAGRLGGDNGRGLIEDFARSHPSDRIRFAACRARAQALAGPEERAAYFDETAAASQGFVKAMAEREARRIRAARPWYDRSPIPEAAP